MDCNACNGQRMQTLSKHGASVRSAVLSDVGATVLTASDGGAAKSRNACTAGQLSEEEANDIIKVFAVMYVQRMSHSTVQLQDLAAARSCADLKAAVFIVNVRI